MKLLSLIICFLCALNLCADAVLVIKGKGKYKAIRLESRSGLGADIRTHKHNMEISFRPRKKFQKTKMVFKVVNEDELSFTFGGGYIRSEGNKKNVFEWLDCNLLRINGTEHIGPKAGKEGKKEESISRPKALPGSVKVKKGEKLTIELSFRSTPKKTAKQLDAEKNMTPRQKERAKREAEREKAKAALRDREAKERLKNAEANRKVLAERYGIKFKETAEKSGQKERSEKEEAPEKSDNTEEQESPTSESGENQ
jgi:hypothetical protein